MNAPSRARYQRIKELFNEACERDADQRASLLRLRCGDDPDLLAEVEALLSARSRGEEFLAQPVVGARAYDGGLHADVSAPPLSPAIPERIGRYRIIRLLGEGGMGSVFEAEQESPKRRVALKIIRPGLMSAGLRRRFQHEVRLLGRLQHPGIAQIFEAGSADGGRGGLSYFAMELIEGEPLLEYADECDLDPAARLVLFLEICDAVQHAHHRGVIHRDLKPANILVDRTGRPKVLDFGIARATDSDMKATLQTDVGQLVGTIPYMSPEQVDGDPDELDTRCDVYALGVLLFELLCGRLPIDVRDKPMLDAVRAVREEEPTRIGSVDRSFRGDLETILLKALDKDRASRYQSVSELKADVLHFLREEPITARPPSVSYQMRKFARRNKALVGGVVVAGLGLTLGAAAAVWNALEANAERDIALRETAKAEQVSAFLLRIINEADPNYSDSDVTVREAVDRAAAGLEAELPDDPELRVVLYHRVGQIYHRIGRFEDGERYLRTALEVQEALLGDDEFAAALLTDLAWSHLSRDDPGGAEAILKEALKIRRRIHGDESAETAALRVYLANVKNASKEYAAAAALAREALAEVERILGPEHEEVAFARTVLAHALTGLGETAEAERLYRTGLATQRMLLGDHHMQVGFTLNGLANCLSKQGRDEEAAVLNQQAQAIQRRRVGP